MVLLKGFDARGFVFYTNYDSRKAHEIEATHHAALLFYWASLERQVASRAPSRACPTPNRTPTSRRARSRAGGARTHRRRAAPIDSRESLEAAVARVRDEYGDAVPRPAGLGRLPRLARCIRILAGGTRRTACTIGSPTPRPSGWRAQRSPRARQEGERKAEWSSPLRHSALSAISAVICT
jgi:pyridoxamine 5'-phosphate oxidase